METRVERSTGGPGAVECREGWTDITGILNILSIYFLMFNFKSEYYLALV